MSKVSPEGLPEAVQRTAGRALAQVRAYCRAAAVKNRDEDLHATEHGNESASYIRRLNQGIADDT